MGFRDGSAITKGLNFKVRDGCNELHRSANMHPIYIPWSSPAMLNTDLIFLRSWEPKDFKQMGQGLTFQASTAVGPWTLGPVIQSLFRKNRNLLAEPSFMKISSSFKNLLKIDQLVIQYKFSVDTKLQTLPFSFV